MAELASRDTVDGRSQGAEEEGGNPAEDDAATSARRRLVALVLRTSEKEILSLAASELEARDIWEIYGRYRGDIVRSVRPAEDRLQRLAHLVAG